MPRLHSLLQVANSLPRLWYQGLDPRGGWKEQTRMNEVSAHCTRTALPQENTTFCNLFQRCRFTVHNLFWVLLTQGEHAGSAHKINPRHIPRQRPGCNHFSPHRSPASGGKGIKQKQMESVGLGKMTPKAPSEQPINQPLWVWKLGIQRKMADTGRRDAGCQLTGGKRAPTVSVFLFDSARGINFWASCQILGLPARICLNKSGIEFFFKKERKKKPNPPPQSFPFISNKFPAFLHRNFPKLTSL